MIATRTLPFPRARPFLEPLLEAIVSFPWLPSPSERVSTMSWLTVRLRSRARCASFSFSSSGMRRRTSPFSLGRPLLRPELSKGTAKREARMPTARSLRLPSVASTSRARSRLRSAGMRTRTSLRSRAITQSDSTNVLSSGAKLLADEQDPLHHSDPRRRGEECHRRGQNEVVDRREHEPCGDDHDALGSAPKADVPPEAERLGSRPRVADEERAGDGGEREC